MDIQLIIVILIGIAVGIVLLRQVWHFFTSKETSHCGGCTMCELPQPEKREK
jgi:7-cyano-7-deazaguanine synthase in queuosine biosynthesis